MLEVFETTIPQLTGEEKRKVYVYVPDFEGAFPALRSLTACFVHSYPG